MNREQELMVLLQGTCGDIVQEVAKIHRFGKSQETMDKLTDEFGGLLALVKLLTEEGYVDGEELMLAGDRRIKKLEHYMNNKKW